MKTEPDLSEEPTTSEPVAPNYQVKRSRWQKWVEWNGSFLVISILLHVVLLGGATMLVVKVVEDRKEKLKFTAPPPTAGPAVEHKVKVARKSPSAPEVSRRITSTASNTSVALPSMSMNASSGPDVMSSMMNGVGSGELGAGGGGPIASMPLAGLTAFGFKGTTSTPGLVGHLYDLTRTKEGAPTNIKDDGTLKNPHLLDSFTDVHEQVVELWKIFYDQSKLGKRADLLTESVQNHAAVVNEFTSKKWDESVLKRYYQAKNPVMAFQIFIPNASADDALKAFGVENEVKTKHFLIHYKGFVKSPKDATYRFRVAGYNTLLIRFNNENVYGLASLPLYDMTSFQFKNTDSPDDKRHTTAGYQAGKWFRVQPFQKCPLEIVLETNDRGFFACIMIEERVPSEPYPRRLMSELYPQDSPSFCYPVFSLKKGVPFTPYNKEAITRQKPNPAIENTPDRVARWRPSEWIPETLPEPLVFTGVK